MRLAGAGLFPNMVTAVLLTHLHSDHICALNDVITSHWVTSQRPMPLAIHGPVGTASVVAVAGDTVPCAGLDDLCPGADLYVQTVIRDDPVALVPSALLQDSLDHHSTVAQGAQTATLAGVGTLVLTHYVPPLQPGQEDEWRAIAAEHFAGDIVLGDDLTRARAD